MRPLLLALLLIAFSAASIRAQPTPDVTPPPLPTPRTRIQVSPNAVNAYSQGATSVLLTFGGLINKSPAEATWCGALISAAPDLGFRCDPATIFGSLPQRYDQSRLSGNNAFTDIMSITPAIARRAYLNAVRGNTSTFFYVRRFVSTKVPDPRRERPRDPPPQDEFVPVTIRLSGNGANVPLSLTEVKLTWGVDKPILFVKAGEKLPRVQAEITYTGSGRLKGRWELVKPGEMPPQPRDLLTEATLPFEERGTQKKYTEISRFNLYLPPNGKVLLPGPEVWRVDESLSGLHQILLRIEASDDNQGNSDLAAVGAGPGVLYSGAVAGFSLPALKYYVSNGSLPVQPSAIKGAELLLIGPENQAMLAAGIPVDFTWSLIENAATYRLEVQDLQGNPIVSAILLSGVGVYRAPSWLKDKVGDTVARWRVTAFGQAGQKLAATDWRSLRFDQGH